MKSVTEIQHPLMQHYLTCLRDKLTPPIQFREYVKLLSILLAYEASRDLKTSTYPVETPLEKFPTAEKISEDPILVSIMRAGNGMLDAMLEVLPFAQAGHVGIYRDKFIQSTVEYYFKVPEDIANRPVFLIDPLLATGDTAASAIARLKEYGAGNIRFICLLAAPQGIKHLQKDHADVRIFCAAIERDLNEKGYILPGLGDAGNRLYGTVLL